jgi:hypothetical protein
MAAAALSFEPGAIVGDRQDDIGSRPNAYVDGGRPGVSGHVAQQFAERRQQMLGELWPDNGVDRSVEVDSRLESKRRT